MTICVIPRRVTPLSGNKARRLPTGQISRLLRSQVTTNRDDSLTKRKGRSSVF